MKTVESIYCDVEKEQWRKENFLSQISFDTLSMAKKFMAAFIPYLSFTDTEFDYSFSVSQKTGQCSISFFSDEKNSCEKINLALSAIRCYQLSE